ncbi:MAG: mammalian cell entry protein [Mycobacterium sp.]
MEDQPTDSGDLTTDAAATETPTPRRRHRLPLQKERQAFKEGDQVAEIGDEGTTAEEVSAAEGPTTKPRRRWNFLRRKKNRSAPSAAAEAVPETPAETPDTDEVTPAPRTPVGKASRGVKPAADASDDESEGQTTEAADGETILVPHEPAGKRLRKAAVAAAVLFVGAGAFAGAMVQPVLADRALVQTKLDIARTAANAITTLWTYNPDDMDSLADRSAGYLTGDFASEYRKFIDAIVATNKQAQVTNNTQVLGTAVESLTPSEATAVVYTNSVATSPVSKNIPSLRYLSYRLTMEREHSEWRITRMTTITALDLTPQL